MNLLLLPIQLVLTIFLLFAISRVYLRFREGTLNMGSFLFWTGLWLLAIFSIFNPQFTTYLAQLFGIGRGADAIIYVSLVILFYLIFRTNVMVENLRDEISHLVREIVLKEKLTSSKKTKLKQKKR